MCSVAQEHGTSGYCDLSAPRYASYSAVVDFVRVRCSCEERIAASSEGHEVFAIRHGTALVESFVLVRLGANFVEVFGSDVEN